MPNITHSIQEYCKKINSSISFIDIISLFITAFGIGILFLYISFVEQRSKGEVIYQESSDIYVMPTIDKSLPFGSASGKTYTFSWCGGASRITEKNKVVFPDEVAAKASGRTLSKLCQK